MFIWYVLAIPLFILLNAFFAGSEVALTSINKIRLRHLVESGDKPAIAIDNFIRKESQFLGTTLVGTNISVITSSALATQLLFNWFGSNAAVIATVVMATLILVFGEIVPKTIFHQSANTVSRVIIFPLKFMHRVLYPMVFVVTGITNFILRPLKAKKEKTSESFPTRKDIEVVLRTVKQKGFASPDKNVLIQRIFKLGATKIVDIMIPIKNATSLNVTESIQNIKDIAAKTRFSRFPVYENQNSNIIGIINIYDILFATEEKVSARDYLQTPFFIDANEPVDQVLSELRKKKKPMAIVTDTESKTVGLVTIEDLLEEIVGEIEG